MTRETRVRLLVLALAATCALPAAAQTSPALTDAAYVSRLLGAIWRPLPATPAGSPQAMFQTACEGAIEEMSDLDLRLPEQLTPEALAPVRAPRGLVIVPTAEDPAAVYIFPNQDLGAIASGLGQFRLDPGGPGRLVLRDAAGGETQLQLGAAAGQALMRLRAPGQSETLLFVGCASTTSSAGE